MRTPLKYGSHLAALIAAVEKSEGDILELGTGMFSTPYLHGISVLQSRNVLSLDNDIKWLQYYKDYQTSYHKFAYVDSWDTAPIDRPWDVALIDHAPAERRIIDIKRLVHLAKYIIIHDSNGRYDSVYHYNQIYPLFKYQVNFIQNYPSTTVLSNLVPLADLF